MTGYIHFAETLASVLKREIQACSHCDGMQLALEEIC